MLKTIKKTAQMRLDELIKYVRQNKKTLFEEHVAISFKTKDNKGVIFANNGNFVTGGGDCINIDDLFEVVIEEEITEDTEFGLLVEISKDSKKHLSFTHYNFRLNQVIDCDTKLIYALIGDKLELIWEAEDND